MSEFESSSTYFPQFIAIDGSSFEDDRYPIAIAWSTTEGQIKTTLIQPEDDWEGWDYSLQEQHGIEPETLYQLGETSWSVIRELEQDLSEGCLFSEASSDTEYLLEMIYQACQRELSIEIQPSTSEVTIDINELQHLPCDERVRSQLLLWNQQQTFDY